MDNEEYHDIVRSLVAMMANQDRINERLTTAIERVNTSLEDTRYNQDRINQRLTLAIEGIDTTLARVENLIGRIMRNSENGRNP